MISTHLSARPAGWLGGSKLCALESDRLAEILNWPLSNLCDVIHWSLHFFVHKIGVTLYVLNSNAPLIVGCTVHLTTALWELGEGRETAV